MFNVNPGDMAIVIGSPIESNNNIVVQVGELKPPMSILIKTEESIFINDSWCFQVDELMDLYCPSREKIIGRGLFVEAKYLIPLRRDGFELSDSHKKVVYEESII